MSNDSALRLTASLAGRPLSLVKAYMQLLEMQRHGVVDSGVQTPTLQVGDENVSLCCLNSVLVIDMAEPQD